MSHQRNVRQDLLSELSSILAAPTVSDGQQNHTSSSLTHTTTSQPSSRSSTRVHTSSQLQATSSSASPTQIATLPNTAGISLPSTSIDISTVSRDVTIYNTITENITSVTAASSSSSSASVSSFSLAPSSTPTLPPQVSIRPSPSALSHGAVGGIVVCLLSIVILALAALIWHRRKRASAVHEGDADNMRSVEGLRSAPPSTFMDDKSGTQGDASSFPSFSPNRRGTLPSGTADDLAASAPALSHQIPVREVDARSVHVSEYWDDRHSDIGGTSGPLPPAYEDVPPRRPFPSSQTNGLRTSRS
ncbi:hypothetical protein BD309DRAFT_946112, partial [Dichomitus squalens]